MSRAAAPAVMGDGPDAVDVRERPGSGRAARAAHQRPREVRQMIPRVPKRPFQRVAQLQGIAVLTEHQRDDEPIVGGPHAPVGADHAVERAVRPAGDVRGLPYVRDGIAQIDFRRVVNHVVHGDAFSGLERGDGLAHGHAVQDNDASHRHGDAGELVFGGDIRDQLDALPVVFNDVALGQIAQGHDQIVFRIDTEDFLHSRILWAGAPPGMAHGSPARRAQKKESRTACPTFLL